MTEPTYLPPDNGRFPAFSPEDWCAPEPCHGDVLLEVANDRK